MYKNWKAICQITDTHFMWALALLDLTTDLGRMVAERFPEYFSNKQQAGPIPLSVLQITAQNNNEGSDRPEEHLVAYNTIPSDWPLIKLGDDETVREYKDHGFQKVPKELEDANEVGVIYDWNGKKLVLVERAYVQGEEWEFVPAELIAVDK